MAQQPDAVNKKLDLILTIFIKLVLEYKPIAGYNFTNPINFHHNIRETYQFSVYY